MFNTINNDSDNLIPNSGRKWYQKKKYIICSILSLVILSLLIVILSGKKCESPLIPYHKDHFFFQDTLIRNTEIIAEAGQINVIILEFFKNNSYYVNYDLKSLHIIIENYGEAISVKEIHKGKISLSISSKKSQSLRKLFIIINNIKIPISINYTVKPATPSKFEILNFEKFVYTGTDYKFYINFFDDFDNNIIYDDSCGGYENLPDFKLGHENIFSDFRYSIEEYNAKKVFAFYFRYIIVKSTLNFNFTIMLIINNKSFELNRKDNYILNIYRPINTENTRINFFDNSKFEILLFDSYKNPIDFSKEIKIKIQGDGIGCNSFAHELIEMELSYVIKKDETTGVDFQYIRGEVPNSLISSCQEYYILSFSDLIMTTNIIYYYKQINIYDEQTKDYIPSLYDSMKTKLQNPERTDMAIYLKKIVDGFGFNYFFDFSDEIRNNPERMKAALYFALIRIFQKFTILHYEIIENLTLHGDIYILNNRFQIIPAHSAIGKVFLKIKLFMRDDLNFNLVHIITIYLDENYSMLVPNLNGIFDVFYFDKNKNFEYTKLIIEEIALQIIIRTITPYAFIYSDLKNLYDMIIKLDPSLLDNFDSFKVRTKEILGSDIIDKYEAAVAFHKNRYIDFDVLKELSNEFIHTALSFVAWNSFKNRVKFLSIDINSIKLGLASGIVDIIIPQGSRKTIEIKDKKVYEYLVYCLDIESKKIVTFYTYSLYINFNFLINTTGSEKTEFLFIPDIPDGRKTNLAIISDIYIEAVEKSIEYLSERYIEIRKKYEDKDVNPDGSNYDLCRDNSVKQQKILMGKFHSESGFDDNDFGRNVLNPLSTKGFSYTFTKNENDFIREIETNGNLYTSAWIIPTNTELTKNFAEAVYNFYKSGKAIFLWGDNDYYYRQSNSILKKLFNREDFYLVGNYPGQQKLKSGDGWTTGTFDKNHPISAGFVNLYEGITVCSWSQPFPDFKSFGMLNSPPNKPVIFYKEGGTIERRILIDCGFTKLYSQFYDENTRRYITNAACWLSGLENDPDVEN